MIDFDSSAVQTYGEINLNSDITYNTIIIISITTWPFLLFVILPISKLKSWNKNRNQTQSGKSGTWSHNSIYQNLYTTDQWQSFSFSYLKFCKHI